MERCSDIRNAWQPTKRPFCESHRQTTSRKSETTGTSTAPCAQRAEELRLSRLSLDALAGTGEGYSSKVLGPAKMKIAGHQTLMPLLGALALKLVIVEDPDALARLKSRMEPAHRVRQRWNNHNHK